VPSSQRGDKSQRALIAHGFPLEAAESDYRGTGGVGRFCGITVRVGVGFSVGFSVLRQFA
jgi:hypothetical protein